MHESMKHNESKINIFMYKKKKRKSHKKGER